VKRFASSETSRNRYSVARLAAESDSRFIDLICTNFHECGLRYDTDAVRRLAADYFASGRMSDYHPDPLGAEPARTAVSDYYKAAGLTVEQEQIVITASASESYSHLFSALLSSGDQVLLPRPSYPLFEEIAVRAGVEPRYYDQHVKRNWAIDPDDIVRVVEPETAAIVIVSPNNPTGYILSDDEIRAIGEICARNDMLLIHDEVFSEYRYGEDACGGLPRPAALCRNVNTAAINGVSKLLAAPDLKVSWMAVDGPDRSTIVEQLAISNDLFLSASPVNQQIVARLLAGSDKLTGRIVAEVGLRRDALIDAVAGCPALTMVPPRGGIHAVLTVDAGSLRGGMDDESIAIALLEKCRVGLHPGYLYGIEDQTALVVSFLPPREYIRNGMKRVCDFLS
jgi:alanine-synthesizing transaminase